MRCLRDVWTSSLISTFCFCCELLCHSAFLQSTLETLKSRKEHLFFVVVVVGSPLHMFMLECLQASFSYFLSLLLFLHLPQQGWQNFFSWIHCCIDFILCENLFSNCQLMLLQKIDDFATLSQTRMLLNHGRLQQIAWVLHYAIS